MLAQAPKAALVSLFAMLASGCASQNAMTTLPDDVRLSVLAESARVEGANTLADPAEPAPSAALSAEEQAFRLRQAAPERFDGAAPETADDADPEALFRQALARQGSGRLPVADMGDDPEPSSKTAIETDATAIWNQMLAMRAASGNSAAAASPEIDTASTGPAGTVDDTIRTAAIAEPVERDPGTTFTVTLDARSYSLSREDEMRIALKRKGGRVARRIVIGRIEGTGAEVLGTANTLGQTVASMAGGDPGIAYDPSLPVATIRIEYEARLASGDAS